MKIFIGSDGYKQRYKEYTTFYLSPRYRHITYFVYQIPDTSYAGRVWNSKLDYLIKK